MKRSGCRVSGVRCRAAAATALLLLVVAGCRQDMQDQPRYEPLETSSFFEDHRASRPVLPGTVPVLRWFVLGGSVGVLTAWLVLLSMAFAAT